MVSLRTQTIKIVAISLVTIAIAGTVWVILESRMQQEQKLFLEGSELAVSAAAQAQILVTGLLVPEEFGSISIHLGEMKQNEKLSEVQIIQSPLDQAVKNGASNCKTMESGTLICVNRSERTATTVTPISLPDKKVGFLMKRKQLSPQELQTTLFFPLVALISGFFSAFLVIALWVSAFLKRHVREPLLSLKEILGPVLQNEKGIRFPRFKVEEVQALANQMGQLVKEFEERKVNSAIAETARTLAHDLKRPMVIIKMGLESIVKARTLEDAGRLAASLQVDVDQTLSEADDIIETTMDFGEKPLAKVSTPPELLISTALKNIFRLYPSACVPIRYDLKHTRDVSVDVSMALRIFANIIGNAVEAMRGKGELTFATRDVSSDRVRSIEFSIENTNSSIPEDQIPKVFEAFFTSGKPHGRGLGLAIAQKVVTDHGGKIWCVSLPEKKVRFHYFN